MRSGAIGDNGRSGAGPGRRGRDELLEPANDTPAAVREWLDHFDDRFVGLIGGNAETAQVLDELHLPRTELHVDPPDAPPHDHGGVEQSGVVNLFGPGDRATVVHSGGTTTQQYTGDIQRLLTHG